MGRLVTPMIDFAEVEQAVERLNQQLSAGTIDRQVFRTHLIEMIDFAEDGYFWMVGYQTGLWYRHDGTQWLIDNPDRLKSTLPSQHSSAMSFDGRSPHSSLSFLNHRPPQADQDSVNWLWFFAGVILLGFIAGIVYTSI
ncbi:MAG: hypothetical protein KDJ97_13020 [Anaerolineae bacterium]|nr:hypothetical protein [Anaerolineae bacterium]MCB9108047.1 hypothetical protein [Anaerolineales bacterium]